MQTAMFLRIVGAWGLALAALAAAAQSRPPTVEQIGKDPNALRQETEAEQKRSQEQAQQQQRKQQEADQQWNDTLRQQQSRDAANMAQAEAVRRTWQQRPPLAPERNRLLGRWESLGAGQRQAAPGVSPEMAQLANALLGGVTGGMCDSMLGRGTIEFRPTGPVAIGRDGSARPMYRAEYRGDGSHVVVLPQGGTTFTHMIIDFDGSDRATVAAVGCVLVRAGAGTTKAAMNAVKASEPDTGAALQWTLLGTSPANGARWHRTIRAAGAAPHTRGKFMFDHVKFGVTDYAASKAFFLKALEPLGVAVVQEGPPTYGVELSGKGKVSLCLYQSDEKPAHLHLAFTGENRQQVEAFYRAALEAGGKDNGAPGLRPHYHANYYAAFVIGPDGHNIEVVCHEPEGSFFHRAK